MNKQWRVDQNADFMIPPDAYFLLNCELGTTIKVKNQDVSIGITGNNLLNTVYRNYLNRFRYYADEMGRNISLKIKIPFNQTKN